MPHKTSVNVEHGGWAWVGITEWQVFGCKLKCSENSGLVSLLTHSTFHPSLKISHYCPSFLPSFPSSHQGQLLAVSTSGWGQHVFLVIGVTSLLVWAFSYFRGKWHINLLPHIACITTISIVYNNYGTLYRSTLSLSSYYYIVTCNVYMIVYV